MGGRGYVTKTYVGKVCIDMAKRTCPESYELFTNASARCNLEISKICYVLPKFLLLRTTGTGGLPISPPLAPLSFTTLSFTEGGKSSFVSSGINLVLPTLQVISTFFSGWIQFSSVFFWRTLVMAFKGKECEEFAKFVCPDTIPALSSNSCTAANDFFMCFAPQFDPECHDLLRNSILCNDIGLPKFCELPAKHKTSNYCDMGMRKFAAIIFVLVLDVTKTYVGKVCIDMAKRTCPESYELFTNASAGCKGYYIFIICFSPKVNHECYDVLDKSHSCSPRNKQNMLRTTKVPTPSASKSSTVE
ncbi:Hypothetical predicted protein [Octopus vulgaris]|uniref:Uncharacterized protein n=1 Tax=Octopus vulgaris TaxID=6645 RepID=A0AA36BKH8_OCTVU|nr:Hypothetical predicted protein [Octopus vulgaris]